MSFRESAAVIGVPLSESTVALLLTLRNGDHEALNAVVLRLASDAARERGTGAEGNPQGPHERPREARSSTTLPPTSRYRLTMLGESLSGDTLGELFAKTVDALSFVAPDAVEALARKRARTRFYVAKERSGVHPRRPDLRVLRSRSGWWVSANIGSDDLKRGLRAMCEAADLDYGSDVHFR